MNIEETEGKYFSDGGDRVIYVLKVVKGIDDRYLLFCVRYSPHHSAFNMEVISEIHFRQYFDDEPYWYDFMDSLKERYFNY